MNIPDEHAGLLTQILVSHLNELWREYEENKNNDDYFYDQAFMTADEFRQMIERLAPSINKMIDICDSTAEFKCGSELLDNPPDSD